MKYTVHEAKTNLSRLLKEASEGKEVVIARGEKPVARVVAIGEAVKKRVPGKLAGKISADPDAFVPLTEKEMKDLGFE